MPEPVVLEMQGAIARITVNNPPVNALSHAVRAGLLDCVRRADRDTGVDGIVIVCAGRTFIAGADISEFGKPPREPILHDVLAAIERASKPVVAAIHGTALGGGLELALCCHYRVATSDARIGLPEVKLGLLPGAGGTQRLPRVLGVEAALDAMLTGRMLDAPGVAERGDGAIDAVLDGSIADASVNWLRGRLAESLPLRRVRDMPVPGNADAAVFERFETRAARETRGQFAPRQIIACVRAATELDFDEGLKFERARFGECMQNPQSGAMRHLFFAEREAARIPDVPRDTPRRPINAAAVVGAGTMGAGIAMCFANAGIPVTLTDASSEALNRAVARIRDNYDRSAARGRLDTQTVERRMGLITAEAGLHVASRADLVVEAVYEDLELKKQIFAELARECRDDAILATNTSTLDVNQIAASTTTPERVLGLHFFSPANVMRLVEVVRGQTTANDVLATAMGLVRRLRKVGVVSGVCYGFIGNRMLEGYAREAGFLLLEGVSPERIDRVMRDFGFPMGPLQMGDLAGNDVGARVRAERRAAGELPEDPRYGRVHDRLAELGRHGQKSGKGLYRYGEDGRTPEPDPEVERLIREEAEALGVKPREVSDREILERCLLPLINEGLAILEEGIALRASDIDIVWVNGYGFPVYEGGPMYYAEQLGLGHVLERLRHYGRTLGNAFDYWTPAPLLEQLAAQRLALKDWTRD